MNTDEPTSRTLYLIRHGETDWNARRLLQGRRDIPLNAVGQEQAVVSGTCLNWLLPNPSRTDFIASPLSRTRQTMEIIRQQLGLVAEDYRTDARLVEIHFGEWEGLDWQQIAKRQPERYAARQADPLNFMPTGGENYPHVFERVGSLLSALQRDTVLVAHAGVLRSCLALLTDVPERAVPWLEIPQDQVLMLRDGRFAWMQVSTAPEGSR
ncbi:histidine phosphatase family protein [Pseudomonas sp. UBA1879]|uniref:histidine phosphatase family protein n=1 Tax=Pseudomonas sp. UBA1879 TaxID=1947305 RepID=UPI0025E0665C|nr:histidine phosphatase family protein [Pseudomonas sp. UBA1879]